MKVQQIIQRLKTDRVFLFKTFMALVFLDILSVLTLARVNPFEFVNVLKFISIPKPDTRITLTLYYPKSVKTEKTYENSGVITDNDNLDELSVGSKEKVIQYAPVKNEKDEHKAMLENAKLILINLASDPVNPEGKKVYTYNEIPHNIWLHEKTLYVNIDKNFLSGVANDQWALLSFCIKKSLVENLAGVDDAIFIIN